MRKVSLRPEHKGMTNGILYDIKGGDRYYEVNRKYKIIGDGEPYDALLVSKTITLWERIPFGIIQQCTSCKTKEEGLKIIDKHASPKRREVPTYCIVEFVKEDVKEEEVIEIDDVWEEYYASGECQICH